MAKQCQLKTTTCPEKNALQGVLPIEDGFQGVIEISHRAQNAVESVFCPNVVGKHCCMPSVPAFLSRSASAPLISFLVATTPSTKGVQALNIAFCKATGNNSTLGKEVTWSRL